MGKDKTTTYRKTPPITGGVFLYVLYMNGAAAFAKR
jgi:hypothetical protein